VPCVRVRPKVPEGVPVKVRAVAKDGL
jgi:hypothetical protein